MTSTGDEPIRILGSLPSAGGTGIVRIEDRFETSVDDLWAAVTEPARLARWYGEVDGALRVGGDFSIYIESDGWRGSGHVDTCERPERLLVTTRESDESFEQGQGSPPCDEAIEATLAADGGSTVLVLEIRGLPLDTLEYYAAGWQIHTEHLGAHIAGHELDDVEARWAQLVPPYEALAAELRG